MGLDIYLFAKLNIERMILNKVEAGPSLF